MRIPRIYIDQHLTNNTIIHLPKETVQHIGQVLRRKMGHSIILFNGQADENNQYGEYLAEITDLSKNHGTAVLKEYHVKTTKTDITLELAQCVSKNHHFEVTLQKAVELGVNVITPVISERSEQNLKEDNIASKTARWQKIIISACEQSGRTDVPLLQPPIELYTWLKHSATDAKQVLITLCTKTSNSLHDLQLNKSDMDLIKLLIGPEGGIADNEIKQLELAGFNLVKLGNRIMRTETAGIASVAIIQYLIQNL